MDKQAFFNWLDFFRGAEVVIGKGKTVWTLAGGWYTDAGRFSQGHVRLTRRMKRTKYSAPETVTYTVKAERVRLAK